MKLFLKQKISKKFHFLVGGFLIIFSFLLGLIYKEETFFISIAGLTVVASFNLFSMTDLWDKLVPDFNNLKTGRLIVVFLSFLLPTIAYSVGARLWLSQFSVISFFVLLTLSSLNGFLLWTMKCFSDKSIVSRRSSGRKGLLFFSA